MKPIFTLLTLSIGLSAGNLSLRAEDAAKPATPAAQPTREEIREQLKNLTPEEREAKLKELREKFGKSADSDEARKRREEFQKLTPEEREAKMKEFRAKQGQRPGGGGELAKQREELKNVPPEERAAKLKELREKMEKRHDELLKKKTEGTLTAEEQEQLNRYDAFKNRQGAADPTKKKD